MEVKNFFDPTTNTLTYVVFDPTTKDAVVIDPVWNYEPQSSSLAEASFNDLVTWLKEQNLKPLMVLETHAHADHLSASQLFKNVFPNIKIAISENIRIVQKTFKNVFNLPPDFAVDGSQFDILFKDFETVKVGSLQFKVLPTPGHTPACVSYLFGDKIFTGDALFMPDYGTGRCDFPAGSAEQLYDSVLKNIYSLPDETQVFVGHDYLPGGRPLAYCATVGEQKSKNVQLKAGMQKHEFVKFRTERDKTLSAPRLLYQSVLVNIDAGHLPAPERNGQSYLKIPLHQKSSPQ